MPTSNVREYFDRHQKDLLDQVLVLGSMVEQAVQQAVAALIKRDLIESNRIYVNDGKINSQRYHLESVAIGLIAQHQPMARDLRFLAAVLEVITELERIGDYAKGISRINILMGVEGNVTNTYNDLQFMADRASSMLHRALSAFITYDADLARKIPLEDDEIDSTYNRVYNDLIQRVIIEPNFADQANYLIWAAHNLERMADRVTNICERVIYVATGEMKELDHSDDELIERTYK